MRVGTKLGALGPGVGGGKVAGLPGLWQRRLPSTWQVSDSRERSPLTLLLFPEALNKRCASLCPRSCQLGLQFPGWGVIACSRGVWEGPSCCFLVSYTLGSRVS